MFVSILCILYLNLFITLVAGQINFHEDGDFCYTPKNESGKCINVKQCESMVQLLKSRSHGTELFDYLRKSGCGFSGSDPMICCPETADIYSNPNEEKNNAMEQVPLLPNKPNCGLSNATNPRIVGGVPAKLNEFPFMVLLGYHNRKNPSIPKWLCGGTLITYTHVLTAAHCIRNDLYLARVGELTLYDDNDGAFPEDIKITGIKKHENFSSVQFTNDIAILTLEKKPTNAWVWPVCLPHSDQLRQSDFVGQVGIVTGWGSLYFDGPRSSTLQVADIPVLSEQNCQRSFGQNTVIDNRIICAGWLRGGKDTCQGDSGGPLLYPVKDGKVFWYYQIGIISYGFRCAEEGYPGVFTRVTNYLDWIRTNIK